MATTESTNSVNSGEITTLDFGGGADDDTLINNAGGVIGTLDFSGDDGLDQLVNDAEITTLNFGGGADDDTLINNTDGVIGVLDFPVTTGSINSSTTQKSPR